MKGPAKSPEDIVGRCIDCDRPMGVESRISDLGIARHAGHGRCDRCAKRARTRPKSAAAPGILPRLPAGMDGAPCQSADPDFWFDHQSVAAAKNICNTRCHLRAACLSYAIRNSQVYGVWGGMSAWQRVSLTEADLYGDDCDGQAAA